MPAPATATPQHIKEVNIRYHDAAAASYGAKWGLDFGSAGRESVRSNLKTALGHWPAAGFGEALEIGAGTGYFTVNLLQLGAIERATATDISDGMLTELRSSASSLGLAVRTQRADAEELPFDDQSFDLVFGHAVLHHLPNLARALAEARRVLRPGGSIAFCGEPSRIGDRLGGLSKRAGFAVAPAWRRMVRAPLSDAAPDGAAEAAVHDLEDEVDVHTFSPSELRATIARTGFDEVRIRGQGMLSTHFGWAVRAVEYGTDPQRVQQWWRRFSSRTYRALERVDSAVLDRVLPAALLYSLMISARRP